jgi:hypothetical protein
VPFCGTAIIEALSGKLSGIVDPFAKYESKWQQIQSNQEQAVQQAQDIAFASFQKACAA